MVFEPNSGFVHVARRGVTLVELLVVIVIITVLMAMLLPAVNVARESGRQAACQNNLRQFGVGFSSHVARRGTYCTGAFDWRRDGCVTEVGWVADLVQSGTPVGKMLCPSNPARIALTFNDLLSMAWDVDTCVPDRRGSPPQTMPDGSRRINPCRFLAEGDPSSSTPPPTGEDRRLFVEKEILLKHFNTNYTASWYLVRSGVVLDGSGNLVARQPGCSASLLARGSTLGPLNAARLDSSSAPASNVPLLGCGVAGGMLEANLGDNDSNSPAVMPFTRGPVQTATLEAPPPFSAGTPMATWWAVWNATLQDYRGFAPVHRNTCNLLFADGSVRAIADQNGDGLLNNGFPSNLGGFRDATVEMPPDDVFSKWSLRPN